MNKEQLINMFCKIFNKNEIEELRPFWGHDIKSDISKESMELIAASIIYTFEKIGIKDFTKHFRIDETPFFDSGYKGIQLYDVNGGKFLIMINEGSCGPEDMSTPKIKIRGRELSLCHERRSFGDCRIHENDFEKNVKLISNSLQLALIGKC